MGVSHNTPYRHFKDRAALLAGVAARDLAAFTITFDGISRSDRTSVDQVEKALESLIAYGQNHPARYRLLFSDPAIGSRGGDLEAVALTTFAALTRLVKRAQQAGKLPAMPAMMLTGLIFATTHGLLDLEAGGRMRAEKGFADALDGARLLLRLLMPSGSRSAGVH